MRKPGLIGACWPEPLQESVLRAAVLEPAAAAAAWRACRDRVEREGLWDDEIHRLLPQVYANLRAAGGDDPDLARLKAHQQRHWYENQLRLRKVGPALTLLRDAEIPLLFLKGVPLALAYYGDVGLRPMGDVDVMVPEGDVERALDLLESQGWRHIVHLARADRRRIHHGTGMSHPEHGELDVHWDLGGPLLLPGDERASSDDFWAAAVPFAVPEHGLLGVTLAPTDMLLHVITHGLWGGSSATVRWVSDASCILRRQAIDWDRLVDQATRRRIAPLLGDALRYLVDEMQASVPEPTIQRLRSTPSTRRERRLLRALTGPPEGPSLLGGLPYLRSSWAYTRLKWGPWRSARELPGFVAQLWELDSPWQIPAGALARARKQLAQRHDGRASTDSSLVAPSVAVVVPTHLRPDDLEVCLTALAAQVDPAEQVIVVRGADDEGAAEVLARHRDLVTEVVSEGSTQVHRLHAGSAVATTSVVAFTDDDAAPHPDWVARLRAHLTDPTVGAVGGRDLQPDAQGAPSTRRVGAIYPWGRIVGGHSDGRGPARDVEHLRGVNMAFRRDLLRFPTELRGPGAQGYNEVTPCLAVRAAGRRVVYDPQVLVDHHVAPRREHGDGDRYRPAVAKRVDEAFNQTYTLLSLRPRRRWLQMAYVLLVGDRSTGGLARCTAAAITGDRWLARQLRPLFRAQLDAWQAWKHHPMQPVSPDEPYPEARSRRATGLT